MHLSIASETLYFQKCSPQHETDLRQYYEQGYFLWHNIVTKKGKEFCLSEYYVIRTN